MPMLDTRLPITQSTAPPAPSNREMVRRLLGYLYPHRVRFVAGIVCGILAGLVPGGVGKLLIDFQESIKGTTVDLQRVEIICVSLVGLYLLSLLLRYGQSVLLAEVAQRVGIRIRTEVYAHLQNLPLAYFHKRRTGALMSVLTSDVARFQDAAMLIRSAIAAPIQVVFYFGALFLLSWKMTLATLVIVPIIAGVIQVLTRQIRSISREGQQKTGEMNALMEETLNAPRIVKAFTAELFEIERFRRANENVSEVMLRGIRRTARLTPTIDLIGAVGIALALFFGAYEVSQKDLSVAQLIGYIFFVNQLATAASSISGLRGSWEEMLGAADRIFGEVLSIPTEVTSASDAVEMEPMVGKVVFADVSFSYEPSNPIRTLAHIDLTLEPGQVVALVGETGAGKSTLADLLPRFYDPTEGSISIDGHDLRTVTLESLRRQIAIVPQETLLFSGSIRDNIAYGRRDATDTEIEAAARAANADSFIQSFPMGYATIIGERGATLSGGERQRVAIARALLADPRLLILDEATSALDAATEALVQEALDRLMRNRTTLIIAHRLSTIVNADKIVVLRKGRIAEMGTHRELMILGGLYHALYETQQRTLEARREEI